MGKSELLGDEDIAKWFNEQENKRRGKNYIYIFQRFLKDTKMTLEQIVKDESKGSEILNAWLEEKKKVLTPKSLHIYIDAIKNIMKAKGINFISKVKAKGSHRSPKTEDERALSPDDLRKILLHAALRVKVVIALMAFAGLRFATIERLKLSDIIDLDLKTITMKNLPALIWVPSHASKIKRPYRTFLIKEGCEYLIEYLKQRKNNGEDLMEDSPLISGEYGGRPLIMRERIAQMVKQTMLSAGFKQRPYVLRGYFDFAMAAANIQHTFQQYFMGHKGDIEAIYAMKKYLPDALIKPLREAFKPAEMHLTTIPKMEDIERRRQAALDALKIIEAFLPNHPAIRSLKRGLEGRLESRF
ncbi:MAG: tyrosine-type recombinase/integrase [Nitrososphaerales archaeon]